ncbi:response regulator transcription factor [Gloeocapsopsis crepidinum LEGE 06123]|uniref:Response regulator transcription factor n=1 Tax=Gloeocapsopsis crepidinum LEGE 06123 TaxID=588587 RepID=A0ABR9UQE7_9CHRO|nr:response regulator transcription factor [Gloeocapsopsis crepidinum]MBE9190273.1 response regulator transcription factor [Gloeocapsopsis crepidinum LEGE 06123]
MNRILIAEDEPRISAFLKKGLEANGFATTVVEDGNGAAYLARSQDFDVMLLDLVLPGKHGLKVLEEIRDRGEQLPIIILTAFDDVQDKVAGLEAGADDYITKPFRLEELIARVRVQLRKTHSPQKEEMLLQVGNIVLDLRKRQVQVAKRLVELPIREFTLLEMLMRHPGEVISREDLLNHVWGYDYEPNSNIVDVYIGYLRKKLGNKLIETVRGIGYRLRE